jgi:light-regulated signal transduction histidine kinase (bacteriophytochrome)
VNAPSPNEDAALRELQRFSDAAIHDVRASLRGIGMSATMLSREWTERVGEPLSPHLRSIVDGVARLDDLTRALSEYATALLPDRSAFVTVPLANTLQTALTALDAEIRESNANVHFADLPSLEANHEQLAILFRCLLSNAIAYRGDAAPCVEILARRNGEDWHFTVTDNGLGIAPRYQRQVFEAFQRLQSGGAGVGLGLAICKRIVEGHGGRIWLDSAEGCGTTVAFTLPAAA